MLVLVAAAALPGLGEEPRVQAWLGAGARPQRAMIWNWAPLALQTRPAELRIQLPPRKFPLDAFRDRKGTGPGATVVIWGDASMDRQEEMLRFARDFSPLFRNAFDVGLSSGVGAQFLNQLMELAANPNQNPAPASAPSVWYNAQDPWARDPRFWR